MPDLVIPAFGAIVVALFVTELTDKDALLVLTLSTKLSPTRVFFAGSVAFVTTTAALVVAGSILVRFIPILWVRLAGGAVLVAYGFWEARGIIGQKVVEAESGKLENKTDTWRAFFAIVSSLVLLDLAGDATEVLIIVLVAQYPDALLVFVGASTGLVSATAFEVVLGNRLGRLLTPKRIRYVSVIIFLLLGTSIILESLI